MVLLMFVFFLMMFVCCCRDYWRSVLDGCFFYFLIFGLRNGTINGALFCSRLWKCWFVYLRMVPIFGSLAIIWVTFAGFSSFYVVILVFIGWFGVVGTGLIVLRVGF